MREDDEVYKFPFLGTAAVLSPEHLSAGMATPPLHALASVPFKWEEQPGKPRPCTDIIVRVRPEPDTRCLELPPSRKTASPTTVLDGPYNLRRPKFSSFRLFREKQSSFDSSSSSPQSQSYVDVLVGKKSKGRLKMNRLFSSRSLRERRGKKEADDEGSFGFSPASFAGFDSSCFVEEGKMTRNSSYSQPAASTPLWVSMYRSLKRAIPIPWKGKRTRKSHKQAAAR